MQYVPWKFSMGLSPFILYVVILSIFKITILSRFKVMSKLFVSAMYTKVE